jgi:hypothetical protein
MNRKQLSKKIGARLRLRPLPVRLTAAGLELAPLHGFWPPDRIVRLPRELPRQGHRSKDEIHDIIDFIVEQAGARREQITLEARLRGDWEID